MQAVAGKAGVLRIVGLAFPWSVVRAVSLTNQGSLLPFLLHDSRDDARESRGGG